MRLPSPRFILVHSHDSTMDAHAVDPKAHAFGPFDTYEDLVAFDARTPNDTCYRFAIPLIGPEDGDVEIVLLGMTTGHRPQALPLPARDGAGLSSSVTESLSRVIRAAFDDAVRDRKGEN